MLTNNKAISISEIIGCEKVESNVDVEIGQICSDITHMALRNPY